MLGPYNSLGAKLSPSQTPLEHRGKTEPLVQGFHDARTGSVQYLVACPKTGRAAIIDPVLDFDEVSGSIATTSADTILAHAESMGVTVDWILDIHPIKLIPARVR